LLGRTPKERKVRQRASLLARIFIFLARSLSRLGKSRLVAIWEISSAHALTQLDIPACIKTRHAECVLEMKLYIKKRLWPAFGAERRRGAVVREVV